VVNAPGLEFGSVADCEAILAYGTGLNATWIGTVTMPASPPRRRSFMSGGRLRADPGAGTSVWVIVLIVVGALVLLALLGCCSRSGAVAGFRTDRTSAR